MLIFSLVLISPIAEYLQALGNSVHLFLGGHCPISGTLILMAMIGGTGLKQTKSCFNNVQPNLCKVLSNHSNRVVGETNSKALQLGDVQLNDIS
jgi:hypothetical protein